MLEAAVHGTASDAQEGRSSDSTVLEVGGSGDSDGSIVRRDARYVGCARRAWVACAQCTGATSAQRSEDGEVLGIGGAG